MNQYADGLSKLGSKKALDFVVFEKPLPMVLPLWFLTKLVVFVICVLVEKIHPVTGVCFSPFTADGTHQLWVPPTCEREEAYTRNRMYILVLVVS